MSQPLDNYQSGLYDSNNTSNEYTLVPGVCVLPLAEDPPTDPVELAAWSPVAILRLHAPYRMRRMSFASVKQNNPPVVPTPEDAGKFVFLGGAMNFETSMNTTFWDSDWGVSGEYLFVENCVSRNGDGFVLNAQPMTLASDDVAIQQYGQLPAPTIGAVSEGGPLAVAGYYAGQSLVGAGTSQGTGVVTGSLNNVWNYTVAAFYPGVLLNSELVNGGTT